jgi:virginiamycin B lyase
MPLNPGCLKQSRGPMIKMAVFGLFLCGLTCFTSLAAQEPTPPPASATPAAPVAGQQPPRVRRPRIIRLGVATDGVSRPMSDLVKEAVFPVEGSPDWAVVTADSVWITSARVNKVVQLVAATNKVGLAVDVQRPCSGLADGFGSIWIPSCGGHTVVRADPKTAKSVAEIAADPANSEGGITVGAGSVWIVTKPSSLVRIDPKTNTVTATIELPAGSDNPLFSDGFVWISGNGSDSLIKVDPKTEKVVATIPIGPKPRFLTSGAGSIWTLNQGDGTISRVDMKSGTLVATIKCGIQGTGGEITFGADHVWATMFDFPITEVDPKTNTVVKQWGGPGGDGIKFGFGSVWLSNGQGQDVWRISPEQK